MYKTLNEIAKENNEEPQLIRNRCITLGIPMEQKDIKRINERYIPYIILSPSYQELIETALIWFIQFRDDNLIDCAVEELKKMNKFEIIRFLMRKEII